MIANDSSSNSSSSPETSNFGEVMKARRRKKKKMRSPMAKNIFSNLYKLTGQSLGEGIYGKVEICVNVSTGIEYAVNIIEEVPGLDRSKILKEIEINYFCRRCRGCQGCRGCQLKEYFEEANCFYLVFEKMLGGPPSHPTPGFRSPGTFAHPRPCRDDLDSLATRADGTSSQGGGLNPPFPFHHHPALRQLTGRPVVRQPTGAPTSSSSTLSCAPPAQRGCAPGPNIDSHDPLLTEHPGKQANHQLQLVEGAEVADQPASQGLVQQVRFEFFSKPSTSSTVIMASSAQPWGQKRTTLTQELIRRLLNCSKELDCETRRKHLNRYMQLLKNSGYSEAFRAVILRSGLEGYNKIVAADKEEKRPMYRAKDWKKSARWLDKKKKKKNWLGPFWKSCIFVPPTPGSELKKMMQQKEEETRVGGRENWPIKIIETAGRTLEQTLVNTDPFGGNQCHDAKCLPSKDPKNKINCRRNNVCYRVTCLLCLKAGSPNTQHDCYDTCTCYFGQSGKNCHCRAKEHVSKFNSKTAKVREESAFFKHLENSHGGKAEDKAFEDYFEFRILKAYKKPFTMCVEEGTYISSHKGELLNSKSEWHQAKLIRTTTRVVQGGADSLRQQRQQGAGAGAGAGRDGVRDRPREQGRARGQ